MAGIFANPLGAGADPGAFDFCTVSGVRSMGILKWSGSGRKYKWDRKDGAGSQGATLTYRGWDISEGIKFQFLMWTREQIEFCYNTFIPLLEYDATKKNPKPINIQHPVLMANNIFSVVTYEIGELVSAGQQLWSVDITFSEYRPPAKKNATSTPNGSATPKPLSGGSKPTAQDAQDAEIQRLLTEFQKPT